MHNRRRGPERARSAGRFIRPALESHAGFFCMAETKNGNSPFISPVSFFSRMVSMNRKKYDNGKVLFGGHQWRTS
ncbi:MAG: hypothetical protein BAA03_13110 [Caldibacillus debilis]|nr:MAG: hypothetical protein BAA03_13110 [Caldibacillus debilis]